MVDITAFDMLVESHRKQIYQLAYHLTGNHEDADDISQEVFIRAYRSMGNFKGKSKLSTWLHRITVNLSINHLKREARHTHESSEDKILYSRLDSPALSWKNNPLEDVEAEELARRIGEAIESLPLPERIVFVLRVYQELPYREIARTMDCPMGTVMSRLNRARRRLRDKLMDYII
jgi:RNA polymerase sigma-70 factor (ECF subfamily)